MKLEVKYQCNNLCFNSIDDEFYFLGDFGVNSDTTCHERVAEDLNQSSRDLLILFLTIFSFQVLFLILKLRELKSEKAE